MGCWAIGGPWEWVDNERGTRGAAGWGEVDDDESIRAIHAAIDSGISFFDTAANYGAGHSEEVLGRALADRRDRVLIATKFGHVVNESAGEVHPDDDTVVDRLRGDIENSLRRLQTDVIDLYQFHAGEYDAAAAPAVREALEGLVTEGKIRWYGWSTDLPDRARVFADGEHCTAIQFALNVIRDNPAMRQLCAQHDLVGVNKDPLNKGFLTGKFTAASVLPPDDLRSRVQFDDPFVVGRLKLIEALRPILTDGGRTMAQGALAYIWATDPNMVPIPGIRTVDQARENAAAMSFGPLSPELKHEADRLVAAAESLT